MDHLTDLIILGVLLLFSAFFSGAETALISLHPAQARSLVKSKRRGSRTVEKLKEKPQHLLITILIGNNVVNIGASVFATLVATEIFGNLIIAYVTGLLTLAILIFGEIIPKTLSHRYAETIALISAYPLFVLQRVLFPLIWLLERLVWVVNRTFGLENKEEKVISEDELRAMVDLTTEGGAIGASEAELIDKVIRFSDTLVEEVMTPRSKICSVEDDKTVTETLELMIKEGLHSRLPVFHGDLDYPVAVVTLREIVSLYLDKNQSDKKLHQLKLQPPIVVPITQPIKKLYYEFRWKQQHLGLIVDEHGTVVGLITMEDLLEEIMGEIRDETDYSETREIIKRGENSWAASGSVHLSSLEEATGIWLGATENEEREEEKRKPLSLLMIEQFERIPKQGDTLKVNQCDLTVEKMDRFSIRLVRIDKGTNGT
ncbi:MAG TPA: hemolysin family protein [Candidatus Binatia bacterium]